MTKCSLLTASLLLLAAGDLAVGQEPTNQLLRETRLHERVLSPVLEVREFSGEFERWGREMTVNAPKAEVFRWSTPASGTASATWAVLDGPPGSGAAVVGSGSAGSAPRAGSVTVFRIDFRKFFPSTPPAGGTTYWVVLEPVDAAGQAGPQSMPVQLTYAAQLDPAAFAGREGDVVAPSQIALSTTLKLTFLRNLIGEFPDLPAKLTEGAEAVVATDEPLFRVRLTPREPVNYEVEGNAGPPVFHFLKFTRVHTLMSHTCHGTLISCSGTASFPESGDVHMAFSLVAGQLYLLDIMIEVIGTGLTLELDSSCQIDGLQQEKTFPVPLGFSQLLAVIERLPSLPEGCVLFLSLSQDPPDYGSWTPKWTFYYAEITRLSNQ